jgi:hypothetical protein
VPRSTTDAPSTTAGIAGPEDGTEPGRDGDADGDSGPGLGEGSWGGCGLCFAEALGDGTAEGL